MCCLLIQPEGTPPVRWLTANGETQTIGTNIHTNGKSWSILRRTQKGNIIEEIFRLPKKPEGTPPWDCAITLPATKTLPTGTETGICFLLGAHHTTWITKQRSFWEWKNAPIGLTQRNLLASLQLNPRPHQRFFLELMDLDPDANTNPNPKKPQGNWPCLMHLRWLEVLLETKGTESCTTKPAGKEVHSFPMEIQMTNKLLRKLQRGAIVSMALRRKEELPLAQRLVELRCPKDSPLRKLLAACL